MSQIVIANPAIVDLELVDDLARRLGRRGHRVAVLTDDPGNERCFRAQGLPVSVLRWTRTANDTRAPLDEFALRDCRLRGLSEPGVSELRAARRALQRSAPAWRDEFERDPPDLIVILRERGGAHRLVHFVARELGVPIAHAGDGLVPGTLQLDTLGIDGDSSLALLGAGDLRGAGVDKARLDRALAACLAGAPEQAAMAAPPFPPDWIDAALALASGLGRLRPIAALRHLLDWRAACGEPRSPAPRAPDLPPPPFVGVLLQHAHDPRMRIDAERTPGAAALVRGARQAAQQPVVVVPPAGSNRVSGLERRTDVHVVSADAAALVACLASAIVTINDPRAFAGVLAGTPIVRLGRCAFAGDGVAIRAGDARDETLREALAVAVAGARSRATARLATHLLCHHHAPRDAGADDALAGWLEAHAGLHATRPGASYRARPATSS